MSSTAIKPSESVMQLAKRLGAVQELRLSTLSSLKPRTRKRPRQQVKEQVLSYAFVLDFEATCWNDKVTRTQEIIEFSAVLLNLATGKIVDEFQTYVEPQEHPNLSSFCMELTGIKQADITQAMPLRYCMRSFKGWVDKNVEEYALRLVTPGDVIPEPDSKRLKISNEQDKIRKWATFVTWSDWDLNVCLYYECNRKQIVRPPYLNCWIDLRAVYSEFYERRPSGLNGALQELGLTFAGRQHSGIDDARNTAILTHRLVTDGCFLTVTKIKKN